MSSELIREIKNHISLIHDNKRYLITHYYKSAIGFETIMYANNYQDAQIKASIINKRLHFKIDEL